MNSVSGYPIFDPRKTVLDSSDLLPLITSGVWGDTDSCVPRVCKRWKEIHRNFIVRHEIIFEQLASRNWRVVDTYLVSFAITLGLLNVEKPSEYMRSHWKEYVTLLKKLSFLAGDVIIGLDLRQCVLLLTRDVIQCLPDFPMLQELSLNSVTTISNLSKLSHLTQLDLSFNEITDAELSHIVSLRSLTQLDLSFNDLITDAGVVHLVGLRALRQVSLSCNRITNTGLVHLAGLPALTQLDVENNPITDEGLQHLDGFIRLQKLNLNGTNITNAGLVPVGNLIQLEQLYLELIDLTNEGLGHLANLHLLTVLDIVDNPRITDEGLAHLINLKKLKILKTQGTQITDQGRQQLESQITSPQFWV